MVRSGQSPGEVSAFILFGHLAWTANPLWKWAVKSVTVWGGKKVFLFDNALVKSVSRVWLLATPWTAAHRASLSFPISQNFLRLMSIDSVMPSNHLILCRPLLFLPSIFPSIRVFSNESALRIGWPKYRSFSFSISPSNEYSWLISFRIIDVMISDNGCGICVHVAAFPTLLVFRGITHPPEEIRQAEQVSSFLNLSQDPRGRRDFVLWIEPPQLGSSAELSKLSL